MPPSGKVLGAQEMRFLVDSCLDFWLTTGRFNAKFESALAKVTGTRRTLTTNSGSSANLLAVTALTSHVLGRQGAETGRRGHYLRHRVSDDRQSDHSERFGSGFSRCRDWNVQYRRDAAGSGAVITNAGDHGRSRSRQSLQSGCDNGVCTQARSVSDRRLLRCAWSNLSRQKGWHVRRVGNAIILSRPPYHDGGRRRGALQFHRLHANRGIDSGIGAGTVIASRARTTPASSGLAGSSANCRSDTITNTLIRISAII